MLACPLKAGDALDAARRRHQVAAGGGAAAGGALHQGSVEQCTPSLPAGCSSTCWFHQNEHKWRTVTQHSKASLGCLLQQWWS